MVRLANSVSKVNMIADYVRGCSRCCCRDRWRLLAVGTPCPHEIKLELELQRKELRAMAVVFVQLGFLLVQLQKA